MNIDTTSLTRVTVVDETGRVYERTNLSVTLSVQDDGRTLKVLVNRRDLAELTGPAITKVDFSPWLGVDLLKAADLLFVPDTYPTVRMPDRVLAPGEVFIEARDGQVFGFDNTGTKGSAR